MNAFAVLASFEQFNLGVPVSRNKLQPGDLVSFNTYGRASDVRIYIGGGLTVGSSSDGVSIHSLSESYWSSHYLGAKRIPIN
ncbi:C40 family peptidase [Acididesulfobacillus acetoxydans]|nr:NlpC/P60 family protein [Acididesulfobacillus acetoxydans]